MSFWQDGNFVIDGDIIRDFNAQHSAGVRYEMDDAIIRDVVPALCGTEKASHRDIYHAVTLINSFYSTRMGADFCYNISRILADNHSNIVVPGIRNGDTGAVQKIIDIQRAGGADRVAYSFTSKYFSILSRYGFDRTDRFPIYDSVVAIVLDYYFFHRDGVRRRVLNTRNNYDYVSYAKCLDDVIRDTGIEYKQLDTYLWIIGREMLNASNGRFSSRTPISEMNAIAHVARENLARGGARD